MYADVSLLLLSLFIYNLSVWLERKALDVGAACIPVPVLVPVPAPKPALGLTSTRKQSGQLL